MNMSKFKFNFSIISNISIKGDGTIRAKTLELANQKAKFELATQFKVAPESVNLTKLIKVK